MLEFIEPGFFTSLQDTGRFGYRSFGVPVSGAMDLYSSQFANSILGNQSTAASLEMTMKGPTVKFLKPTVIAISGADMQPRLNDKLVKINTSLMVEPESILRFDGLKKGFRSYLAIKNGFLGSSVLKSQSMYQPITESSRFSKGDRITYHSYKASSFDRNAQVKFNSVLLQSKELTVYKGPEYEELPVRLKTKLIDGTFKILKLNNRMAYQLEPLIPNTLDQLLTAPVLPGTVQLTPSGKLIVLMRDCQTTGGYPRVLQLSKFAMNQLSQNTTGNRIIFRLEDF